MNFNILQYLPENTKIKIDKRLAEKLFTNKSLTNWSVALNLPIKNLSRYRNTTRAIPLKLFNKLLKYSSSDFNSFQDNLLVKVSKNGEYLRIGPMINIESNWIYISELLKGDGHITPNFWYINFVNKDDSLIQIVKKFFLSIGLSEKRFDLREKNGIKFLTIRSYVLAYLFYKLLGVLPGNKSKIIDINDFVVKNLDFGRAAVRGAFDAEGSVSFTGSRTVTISSNSHNWVSKLSTILEKLRIKSVIYKEHGKRRNEIYRLHIYGIVNIKRFCEEINPVHQKRKEKLKEIIDSYSKNPEYIFHKSILLSIKKGINRKRDIAHGLKLSLITTANNIGVLKKKKFIEPYDKVISNKGCFFKYQITKKGEEYLKEELLPFFD